MGRPLQASGTDLGVGSRGRTQRNDRLSPPDRLGEFYGLYGLVGKGSQVVGSIFWGIVLFLTYDTLGKGAYQLGLITLLFAMLVGLFLLWPVPEKQRRRHVRL